MDLFSVITLLGGLAFFLYGMNVLSAGLERLAGGSLERLLKKLTASPIKSLLLGTVITAAIQSSSAVTVMLVGLVNSGIMTIRQSIGVIMGSNIGTTMTAWILTLVGIESDTFLMKLLKPENFSLIFAFIGILMIMGAKDSKKKDIGSILVGFAVLMFGMKLMSGAVKPLADEPAFVSMFTAFQNPILGVLVGLVITAVIQSSSASVGILQALAMTGVISYGAAIPIIMGQNIGTCVTALISSFGVTRNAKKVAVVHISFNLIGTAVCLALYCILHAVFHFEFVALPIDAIGIAAVHTLFNVFTTALLLPCTGLLERIANKVLPEKQEEQTELLDIRLLATPSVAVSECNVLTKKMAELARDTVGRSIESIGNYSESAETEIRKNEDQLDLYEDKLGSYLVQVSSKELSGADSRCVSKMLHAIGNFERLGDHALNMVMAAKELHDKGLAFSPAAQRELNILNAAVLEILCKTTDAYDTGYLELASDVEPLEQVVDNLVSRIRINHIQRLQAGECSIVLGFILSDLLGNYERVSDHCSNIAVNLIETADNAFDTHAYLKDIKRNDEHFAHTYETYKNKYLTEFI